MKGRNDQSRRAFVKKSGLLMSAAWVPEKIPLSMFKSKYKMGLQLFTIRDAMEKDVKGTLKTVASLGYQDLETYGYEPDKNAFYGIEAKAFKNVLTDMGLTTSSGHYGLFNYLEAPLSDLNKYVDQCIKGASAIDQAYITWPWLKPEDRTIDKFKLLADRLNVIGERVNAAGLGFAYHNHDFEFSNHDGKEGYDIILNETDPKLVKLQLDLYWVMHSSRRTPGELMRSQPGRFVMWHIKDMDRVTRDYTELGNGSIDYNPILPDAELAGLEYYFLEQGGNFAQNSMQSITDSAKFFKKHLKRYL